MSSKNTNPGERLAKAIESFVKAVENTFLKEEDKKKEHNDEEKDATKTNDNLGKQIEENAEPEIIYLGVDMFNKTDSVITNEKGDTIMVQSKDTKKFHPPDTVYRFKGELRKHYTNSAKEKWHNK